METYLKPDEIYLQWKYIHQMAMMEREKTRKIPVWLPSLPPIYDMKNRLFSGIQENRKQAEHSLNGEGNGVDQTKEKSRVRRGDE